MAEYVSQHSGSEIESVLDLFVNKGLGNIQGVIKRNSNGSFEAVSGATSSSELTVSLVVANWSNNTQTVTATGVTTTNSVVIAPTTASKEDYLRAGIYCSSQGTNSLTFTCDTVPSNTVSVSVLVMDR